MKCETFRSLVAPFVDGELAGEERQAFESHLEGCAGCRAAVEHDQALASLLRASGPLYQPPPDLRDGIGAAFAGPTTHRFPWGWAAAVAGTALVVALGLLDLRSRSHQTTLPFPSVSALATVAADTHLRLARGQLPLEIVSDRPEVVTRWFAGRVPFHLALPDYPVEPGGRKMYHLEGGRLVLALGDYAAAIAYRMDSDPISLVVASAAQYRPPDGETLSSGGLRFHLESVAGLKVITWVDKGLAYALVSDVTVEGAGSCVVCHGSVEERRRLRLLKRQLGGGTRSGGT